MKGTRRKDTCSLEITWTGPIFTDTYLPLADNFCFTRPCHKYVEILREEPQLPNKSVDVMHCHHDTSQLNHEIFHNIRVANSLRQSHHATDAR